MFTFRRATLLFFILLFGINVLKFAGCPGQWISGHFCNYYGLYAGSLLALYFGVSIALAFVIRSGYHHAVFTRGKTDQHDCALTFDDGPDHQFTTRILEILKREGIPATFFLIGHKIQGNELIVKTMDNDGHCVGNHSWSHSPWFDFYPGKRMRKEFIRTADRVRAIIGKDPALFRPPFGVVNPMVSNAIKPLHYHVIGWSIRSFDTLHKNPRLIVDRIMKRLRPGSVILLHDHLPMSPEVLELLLTQLKIRSYRVIPLTTLFSINGYA